MLQQLFRPPTIYQNIKIVLFAIIFLWFCSSSAWSSSFTDTTLTELIEAALSSHPSIKSQVYLVNAADFEVKTARWQFYPTLSVSAEAARASDDDPSYQGDDAVTTFRAQQPLWTGGRLTADLDKAKTSAEISRANVFQSRQQTAKNVVQNYSDWLAAHLKTLAASSGLEVHEDLMGQVIRRVNQGLSSNSDLILARGRLASTRSELATAVAQEEIALSRLSQLVGYTVEPEKLYAARAKPRPHTRDLEDLVSQALSLDPNIQIALMKIDIAKADIRRSKAGYKPDVSLKFEHARGSFFTEDQDPTNRVFLNLSSSLQPGLATLSDLSRARSMLSSAQVEVDWQRRVVREQVSVDHALAISFKTRISALEESLKSSKRIHQSYGRLFLAGKKTWLDLMNAVRDLINTENQLADAQAAHLLVTWRLAIATENLTDPQEKVE